MDKLPTELILIILKYLKRPEDISSLRETTNTLRSDVPLIYLKKVKFEKYILGRKQYKEKCINFFCYCKTNITNYKNSPRSISNPALNKTNIYYLKSQNDIFPLIDGLWSQPIDKITKIQNVFVVDNTKTTDKLTMVERNIPYCYDCMNIYVNYGDKRNNQ